jgi:hypothetical protein
MRIAKIASIRHGSLRSNTEHSPGTGPQILDRNQPVGCARLFLIEIKLLERPVRRGLIDVKGTDLH